jgi:hypothetical protein
MNPWGPCLLVALGFSCGCATAEEPVIVQVDADAADAIDTATDVAVDTVDSATQDTKVTDSGQPGDTAMDADGAGDVGCILGTVTACGACGRACAPTNTESLACALGICSSFCKEGFANCSQPEAPTADDGCECEGDGCCSGGCQTKHNNGLGQHWFDCNPLGTPGTASTYSVTMATAARNAWDQTGTDAAGRCGAGPSESACVTRQAAGECAVWCYTGPLAGYAARGATCSCPSTASLTWQ